MLTTKVNNSNRNRINSYKVKLYEITNKLDMDLNNHTYMWQRKYNTIK